MANHRLQPLPQPDTLTIEFVMGKHLSVKHGVMSTMWTVQKYAGGFVWYRSDTTGKRYPIAWPELRYMIRNHSVEVMS